MSSGMAVGELLPSPRASRQFGVEDEPKPRSSSPTRMIGWAGLLSFDLIVIASLVAPPLWNLPGTNATGRVVAAYTRQNATRITASLFIYSLAMGLFLCFVGGLWAWFRERDAAPRALSSIFGLAGVALVILILAGFVPIYLLGYRTEPASIASLLADLTFGLLALSGIPTAVCLGTYAALVIRYGGLPRWTAYVAATGAIAHVLITASFLSHGSFLSLESDVIVWVPAIFFVWILAASGVLFLGRPVITNSAANSTG